MTQTIEVAIRDQLVERRERLARTIDDVGQADDLLRLLREVDRALGRLDGGSFGQCQVCGEDVEDAELLEHPLLEYCLCRLSEVQQNALQRDLELAQRVQLALLPKQNLTHAGWEVHHRYLPAGPVSGDFCDVVTRDGDADMLHFLLGDVSGKGVAASLLMARLSALFRSLIDQALPLSQIVGRANRLFSESATPTHFATLVCGRADRAGRVELCNAGHCPPLVVGDGRVTPVGSTGLPVGILEEAGYETLRVEVLPGQTLFLYTDGLTEATCSNGELYGAARLTRLLERLGDRNPAAMAAASLADIHAGNSNTPARDDLTIMVLRHTG
jgi:sigma-B regulation protein RsbU (phosphoserine phosphatase)